jgi:DNA-binding CsgD family transcriptional regulator
MVSMIFEEEKVEDLIARCRPVEAAAMLVLARAENRSVEARRLHAAVYAMAGDDRSFARVIDPALLACASADAVAAYRGETAAEPSSYDHLIGGVVLAWCGDSSGAYAAFERSHEVALSERRFYVAVAASERLAHHALLLGEIERARRAIDAAVALAASHRLSRWLLRCLAAAAALALDSGDLDRTAQLLARANAESRAPEALALFAATGAQLAVEVGDDVELRKWLTPAIIDAALHSDVPEIAISATIATLIAGGAPAPDAPSAMALRRALLQTGSAANVPELFSMAARYGDLADARLGVASLAAVVLPHRPYLNAHHLLARAHLDFRSGERAESIDCAGDAARAFSAMGLRRWTNDAMLLLVTQEPASDRRARNRPTGSALTEREQQVAHLIRRGARNREVAVALQISEHTVERHVSSILGRLGLRSRWQIADPRKNAES